MNAEGYTQRYLPEISMLARDTVLVQHSDGMHLEMLILTVNMRYMSQGHHYTQVAMNHICKNHHGPGQMKQLSPSLPPVSPSVFFSDLKFK